MGRPAGGWRIFNLVFVGVFLLFAALQYNDPDPWLWVPIYGYASLVCFLYARGKRPHFFAMLGMFGCLVYAAILLMKQNGVLSWATEHEAESLVQTMKATKPWIENTREFGGLLIILLVLGLNYFKNRPSVLLRKEFER
jgi:hypothetical protein